MNSLKTDRINQMLRERKLQRKKIDGYRNKRIKNKYEKVKEEEMQREGEEEQDRNVQDKRKIDFYNQVFGGKIVNDVGEKQKVSESKLQIKNQVEDQIINQPKVKSFESRKEKKSTFDRSKNKDQRHRRQFPMEARDRDEVQKEKMEHKAEKLKQRKKKFIKKLDQRTKKGQPVMSNYIKYALTKLEEGIVKEKIDKVNANLIQKKKTNKFNKEKFNKGNHQHGNNFRNYERNDRK